MRLKHEGPRHSMDSNELRSASCNKGSPFGQERTPHTVRSGYKGLESLNDSSLRKPCISAPSAFAIPKHERDSFNNINTLMTKKLADS